MVLFHVAWARSYLNFIDGESFRYNNRISYFLFFWWHQLNIFYDRAMPLATECSNSNHLFIVSECLNSDHLLQLHYCGSTQLLCLNKKLEKYYYVFMTKYALVPKEHNLEWQINFTSFKRAATTWQSTIIKNNFSWRPAGPEKFQFKFQRTSSFKKIHNSQDTVRYLRGDLL